MTVLLVRHARAGDRDEWEGDDRLRPLDERGRRQAAVLVSRLGRFPIDRVFSSPYVRCVQTVEPLARERRLPIEVREELAEERQDQDGVRLVRELVANGADAVVCVHGGVSEALVSRRQRKGETFVLDPGDDAPRVVHVIH